MDNDLGANDPYRGMASGEENITPNFLKKNNGESASDKLGKVEQAAQLAMAAKGGKVPSGKSGVSKGSLDGDIGGAPRKNQNGSKYGAEKAEEKESSPNLYNKNSQKQDDNGETQLKMSRGMKSVLMAAAPFLVVLLIVGGFIALLVGLPVAMIGAIDYNLQKVLGFADTIGILEKQGEYVTAELAHDGKMPREYFNDLIANGIDVGQVTANGDFVRTDTYIANIENKNDLVASASGFSYVGDAEGELAMLFDGKVIYADDFVAEVESNPELYAAYSNAADIGTKYYYSSEVEQDYREMGISRGAFNDWETTGNYEEDEKNYFDILNKVLDARSNINVGGAWNDGADREGTSSTFMQSVAGSASEVVNEVANKTKEFLFDTSPHQCTEDELAAGYGRTTGICYSPVVLLVDGMEAIKRAAYLLNSAVSSGEPFLSALVFMAIEEPLQRARVDGDGPVNIVMNALTTTDGKLVKFRDVLTGEEKTSDISILETNNFRAAVSDGDYSKEEALNFGRDRVLSMTRQGNSNTIRNTTLSTNGQANTSAVVGNGIGSSADRTALESATDAIELAAVTPNSEVFRSVVGGNRAIEGGSFISNTINMRELGAMPSNADKISEYHREVEEVMARKAEAERATKSPFDITSPSTFLGSIVHNIATAAIKNYNVGFAKGLANSAAVTTSKAIANLVGDSVMADGNDDEYTTMSGDGCETVGSAGVEGDLYCTSHNTISTKYINRTKLDWDTTINKEDFGDFVKMGMKRYATVGVKNAEVCEIYREKHDSAWTKIGNLFSDMMGLYDSCDEDDVPIGVATGAKYTFGAQGDYAQNELYSGYALYDKVRSLLTGETSTVAMIWNEYLEGHPLDNSRAGVIARISGMEKYEAELALAYADYLNEIASYNPTERFNFLKPVLSFEKPILDYYSDDIALNLYAWYSKEVEYMDVRNRQGIAS